MLQTKRHQDALRDLIEEAIAPHAERNDDEARFPREAIDALGAAGFLGLTVPTGSGGMGQGPAALAEAISAVAYADPSAAMVYQMHLAATACIVAAPPGEERDRILRDIAAGRHLSTLAFSEAGSRSHFWAPVSQERGDGDDVLIDADKSFVTSAGHADSYVVTTRAAGMDGPTDATLYLVRKDAPGLAVDGPWQGMGLRGNASAPMTLCDVRVGPEDRLTEPGTAFQAKLEVVLPTFNLGSAAVSLGICRAAIDRTALHLNEARFEHLGVSLAEALQNLRAYIARMQVATDALQATVDATVTALERPGDTTVLRVLEVKALGAETAMEVTRLAMRACGGAAYGKRVGLERYFRDAQAAAVMAPTTDVLYDFIGKAVLGLPLF